MSTLSEVLGLL